MKKLTKIIIVLILSAIITNNCKAQEYIAENSFVDIITTYDGNITKAKNCLDKDSLDCAIYYYDQALNMIYTDSIAQLENKLLALKKVNEIIETIKMKESDIIYLPTGYCNLILQNEFVVYIKRKRKVIRVQFNVFDEE